jgi:hypothetical protein
LLQVPENQHLAIARGQAVEGVMNPAAQLLTQQTLAGTAAGINEPVDQLLRRGIGHRRALVILASDAAPLGHDMAAVQRYEPIPGELPEPGIKWHGPVREVIRQGVAGLGKHVLHDVRRVQAGAKPPIEAVFHQPMQTFAMVIQ